LAAKTLLIFLLTAIFLTACSTPSPVVHTDQYHEKTENKSTAKALNGLQLKALKLMNQLKFEESILYLQRAIKIEPRNPLNWHYLAQNYWHLKDFSNCRAMVQRAISYSQFNEDLNKANNTLLKQCEG
jgi:Tfp pilus assembly protein PilF